MTRIKATVAVMLLVMMAGALSQPTGPAVVYSAPKPGNIKGSVLVISVNNASDANVASALDCQKAGADGRVQCLRLRDQRGRGNKPGGCGKYCLDYHKKTPPEVIGNAFGCTPAFGRSYLPIQSTQTTCSACGGRTDDKPACTPSGAWLQHTCTLLDGVDPAKPQYQAGGDAEGWLSGTIAVRLPDCGDAKSGKPLITAYECEACSATGARDGCLKCSRQWQASCGFTRARLILGTFKEAIAYLDSHSCVPCALNEKQDARDKCFAQVTSDANPSGWPDLSQAAFKQYGRPKQLPKMWA
ncbi:hypothetical protein MNEG_5255 [Monoraphidium neglectum]|uniref:Uncharacterized protein n=1 Tax=Monoraphidium neglectum TaxID=145388 RepID=A0A0D2NB36_9CHLO|nr:hypothetical protein MNEG_5255 [Monoraphidium neglectum]KIZ02701.1 hypothetical protein MNEG_5255 [Monoraphidium neglectum]|eukprot:XP_013901720.1 hypothetical protein MNEG_5255 [Monoraphidium neglectum]